MSENAAILICIAGAVGAGKTTLARKLGPALGARVVEEEVSGNDLLAAFYNDPAQYALPVQGKFLLSRFCQLRSDCWPKEGAVVTDYIFDKDRLFAELNLDGKELEIYRGLWDAVKDRVRHPDVVIYLRAEPSFLLGRIRERNRSFEQDIEVDYLERLTAGYEKMFAGHQGCPVVSIDSETEPACNEQSWGEMMAELVLAVPELAAKSNRRIK